MFQTLFPCCLIFLAAIVIQADVNTKTFANPATPFRTELEGLSAGEKVTVIGTPKGGCKKFTIDFIDRRDGHLYAPFHFNARMSTKKLMRDTLTKNGWQAANMTLGFPFPFKCNKEFNVVFLCKENGFEITINDKNTIHFKHISSPEKINGLHIFGDVILKEVTVPSHGKPTTTATPPITTATSDVNTKTFENPDTLFHTELEGMLTGETVTVIGTPNGGCDKFTIDFIERQAKDTYIPFHFKALMSGKKLMRDVLTKDGWHAGKGGNMTLDFPFPFKCNKEFNVVFLCKEDGFEVTINDKNTIHFKHILSPEKITGLDIFGDVSLKEVKVPWHVKPTTTATPPITTATSEPDLDLVPWYQLYNEERHDHFYTIDPRHRQRLLTRSNETYVDQGIAAYMLSANDKKCQEKIPVYMNFLDERDNFFTTNKSDPRVNLKMDTHTYCLGNKGECGANTPIRHYQSTIEGKTNNYYVAGEKLGDPNYEYIDIMCYAWAVPADDICTKLGIKNDRTISLGDSCLEISTKAVKFEDAKMQCTKHVTGHLANVNSAQIESLSKEDKLFGSGPFTSYWIGLYQQLPADEPSGDWYWLLSGGEKQLAAEISWGIWDGIQNPSNYKNKENCGALFKYGINDDECEAKRKYICEYKQEGQTPTTTETSTDSITVEPTAIIGTEPTTVINTEPTTVINTEPTTVIGTEPTTVIGTEQTTVIGTEPTTVIGTEPTTVIGTEPTTVIGTEPTTVIGTEPTTVINTEPTTVIGTEPTTFIGTEPTTITTAEPTVPTTTEYDVCAEMDLKNDETISLGNSCFEISTNAVKFEDTKTQCTKHKTGHLANLDAAQIESLSKEDRLFGSGPFTSYWIGLYQQLPADEPSAGWYWLLSGGRKQLAGEISWGIWDGIQNPDNYNNKENCGTLFKYGINDDTCESKRKYICEYKQEGQTPTTTETSTIVIATETTTVIGTEPTTVIGTEPTTIGTEPTTISTTTNAKPKLVPWYQLYFADRNFHAYTTNPLVKKAFIEQGMEDQGIANYMLSADDTSCKEKIPVINVEQTFDGMTTLLYTTNLNAPKKSFGHDIHTYCVKNKGECGATLPIRRYHYHDGKSDDNMYVAGKELNKPGYRFMYILCYAWPNPRTPR